MYSLLLKQFIRSRMAVTALSLLLLMGIISILIGKQFLLRQEVTIARVAEQQRVHIERNVAAQNEMGLLLYYLRFALITKPEKLSALSIGQRDVNGGVQSVTIRTLEAQKYDTDLTNPVQLQSGNLDLGFVIIYLFPLLVIAFTFNLLSEEKENGTWRLVAVQSRSTFRFLLAKLSIRALFVYGLLLALLLIATITIDLPLNEAFGAFITISVLYLAFWFVLSYWLALFKRSSGFNILTLLSVWVLLTVLLPASVNNLVSAFYPIPETLGTLVKQRNGYHEKWDMDKQSTMEKFYAHYPQFEKYGVPPEAFSWLWYYAMQQMGDDESAVESSNMSEKILQREKTSRAIAMVVPTLHTQLYLNDLAKTSLSDYVQLLDSASAFHERTRLYFYPKIFENVDVKREDWTKFKPEYLQTRSEVKWLVLVAPLLLITLGFALWALLSGRHINSF